MNDLIFQLNSLLLLVVFLAGFASYFVFLKALPEEPQEKPPLRRIYQEDTDD